MFLLILCSVGGYLAENEPHQIRIGIKARKINLLYFKIKIIAGIIIEEEQVEIPLMVVKVMKDLELSHQNGIQIVENFVRLNRENLNDTQIQCKN